MKLKGTKSKVSSSSYYETLKKEVWPNRQMNRGNPGSQHNKTFSVYFIHSFGFFLLLLFTRGNFTNIYSVFFFICFSLQQNEPDCTPELPVANRALFLEKVRQSNAACQNGDFATAVGLYTDALALDPTNYILYSNRSAAHLKQGQFSRALQDANKAKELCPQWGKAYFRQGVALQCLRRYGEALAAFSAGLAQDANSKQLLSGLIEASIKSPLRAALEPTLNQLFAMKLDQVMNR